MRGVRDRDASQELVCVLRRAVLAVGSGVGVVDSAEGLVGVGLEILAAGLAGGGLHDGELVGGAGDGAATNTGTCYGADEV